MTSYTHAGISRRNGKFKMRFSTRAGYEIALSKVGDSDIDMIELKYPMSKAEAVEYMFRIDFDNGNEEVRAAMEQWRTRNAAKETAATRTPRPRKSKDDSDMSLESIRARASADQLSTALTADTVREQLSQLDDDLEDAPF